MAELYMPVYPTDLENPIYANTNDHDVKAVCLYNKQEGLGGPILDRLYLDPELTRPCSAEYGLELYKKRLMLIVDSPEDSNGKLAFYTPIAAAMDITEDISAVTLVVLGASGPQNFFCITEHEVEDESTPR